MNSQMMSQAKEPTSTTKPAVDGPVQGVTPTTNTDNLFAAARQLASTTKELTFMTKSKVEAMLKKVNEKASTAMKPYSIGQWSLNSKNLMEDEDYTRIYNMLSRFYESAFE